MKKFEELLIGKRIDFMLAHVDISWLSIECRTRVERDAFVEWSVSCAITEGAMAHIHECPDLGWALEEAYRRAKWNLDTGVLA